MSGSHLSPIEMDRDLVKSVEKRSGQIVIDVSDEPDRGPTTTEKRVPFAWKAQTGDVLVFDERMYHAGRRVEDGGVNTRMEAAKFTRSLVRPGQPALGTAVFLFPICAARAALP
jgi:hypothetical protein